MNIPYPLCRRCTRCSGCDNLAARAVCAANVRSGSRLCEDVVKKGSVRASTSCLLHPANQLSLPRRPFRAKSGLSVPPRSQNAARGYDPWRAASWTLCVRSEPLVLQITDVIDADNVACIADRFIASDVRLAQDVGLSEIAFALRNSRDGFTLWVENGAYRPRPVILLNVRCHADELVTALNKYRGRSTHFLLDLVTQHEVVIHLCRPKM